MKYISLLTIALCITVHTAYGQTMEVKDYFLADRSGDVNLLNWFLCGYKNFTYKGDFGKNKDGCNIRRWIKGQITIESNDYWSFKDGKTEHNFFIIAYMDENNLKSLEQSLSNNLFKISSRDTNQDGITTTIWTPNTTNDISMVVAIARNDFYEVTFIP